MIASCFFSLVLAPKEEAEDISEMGRRPQPGDVDSGGGDDEVVEEGISVVKKTLGSFCVGPASTQLRSRIDALVTTANLAMAEAYLFANFHVMRCLADPAFDVKTLPILDRNFYYRCLLAVSTSNVRRDTLGTGLTASAAAFDALRPDGYVKADLRPYNQAVADLSVQMATMACNNVWANVERIVVRYLRCKAPGLRRWWKKIVTVVAVDPKASLPSVFPSTQPNAAEAVRVAELLRSWYPMPSKAQFNNRAHYAMGLFLRVLKELEASNAAANAEPSEGKKKKPRKARLFNLLPMKGGFKTSYIPISSMTLMKLLSIGNLEPIKGDGRSENHAVLWRKHFNVNAVETRKARFDYRILTDGKGVSIQRRVLRPSATSECDCKSRLPKDCSSGECRLARAEASSLETGVDPGMTDIVTCAFSDGRTAAVSSAAFGQTAGYATSRRRVKAWNAQTDAATTAIPPSKVGDLHAFEAHVRGYLAALPELLAHRFSRGYRSMRFFRYRGKQKAIEMVCDVVAPRDKLVVVGFGDWSNNGSGISRPCSGPMKEIRQRLAARPNVLFKNVCEFRTSCTCNGCFEKLVNMKADTVRFKTAAGGTKERRVVEGNKVHKVLHCRNSVGSSPSKARCGATWNRDVNAAKNILLLLRKWVNGEQRPEVFCRSPKNTISERGDIVTAPPRPRAGRAGQAIPLSVRSVQSEIQ